MNQFSHTTVMLYEAVAALYLKPHGIYIDGTFGRGGHSKLILEQLSDQGRLIVFDRDPQAIASAQALQDPRVTIIQAPFSQMEQQIATLGLLGKIDGILLDLGVSSPQLDDANRGFSFMHNGPLDMRMGPDTRISAREYLYQASETEIVDILWRYGEEKNSRHIARAIIALRDSVPYEQFLPDTFSLVELIKKASRFKDKNKNPATRSFQAIRIAVNKELEELETVLQSSLKILSPGGYISIISFHSLEDRIVKQFFKAQSQGRAIPKNMPILDSQWQQDIYYSKISKALKPSSEEIAHNTRSRSAILRWACRSHTPFNTETNTY